MSYWQLRCAEMKQRSAHLYQSGLWSDCSFKLAEEEVKAHKLIMAAASPVFGKLFYGKEAAESPVPIYDTRPEIFRILLEYIYSDHINLTNLRDACDLHNAAFKWRLPYLKEMCIKFISSSLNTDNVICIYELACQSKEFHLQDDCIKIFKTLTKEILKAESFKVAKLSTLLKIFSMATLNIDSELDLFKAAVNHAAAQEVEDEGLKRTLDHREDCFTPADGPSPAKRSRIDSTGLDIAVEVEINNATTSDTPAVNASTAASRQESHYVSEHDYDGDSPRENDMTAESYADYEDKLLKANIKATRREKYRDLMRNIRFLTLTPQEFAECTTLSFLLPTSAIMALSLNISAKDTFVPMPKHFSTSMVPRNLSQQNEREEQAGTTRITVNNIINLKKFESNPFYIRNSAWTLMLMRLQETVEDLSKDILIVAVTCFFEKGVPEWIGKVEVRVSFISEDYINDRFQNMKLKLSQPCNDYGAWIIKTEWNDLMSAFGIIEDNTVTCKVYVSTNIQKSPTSPDSSPDNTQTDYITTPLRSSTPVSRARCLKEKTQKRSDLTASGLAGTRTRTPLLPEKRSLTPLLPEKRSLTPLLPEKRSLTPLLPEKRSLTPLLPEKRSLTPLLPEKRSLIPLLSEKCSVPSPLIEKRSLTPLLRENRSVTSSPTEKRPLTPQLPEKSFCLSDRSLTPVLPNRCLPPVLPDKRTSSPLIEKHGVAKTPLKRNLSPLPEERNITPPPVENRSLPSRPKKRYLTQSPTEKLARSPEKDSLTSSPLETSHRPVKNGANSSPLPSSNNATPLVPEKHVSRIKSLPINTKSPLSSQATLKSIPASISSPLASEVGMRPKQTGNNNTVGSPQTLNSPVVGPINLNSSDPSIETLKLSVSSKDKPRALTCVQILRSLHRKGYPINGSIAQRYLNELSAMSINGFQVLRPLLAYANASAATNGSGHIVPTIMEKKRDVISPMNSATSASRLIDDNNTKSVTKSEPLILEPIPRTDNVSFASESMAIIDDNSAILNPSGLTDCTDSVNEQNMKQLGPKSLALKDYGPSISEPIPKKDTGSFVSEPMATPEDITATSSSSAITDCQLVSKPLLLKDNGPSISEPIPKTDTVFSVSETVALTDDVKVISNPSALMDGADSIKEKDLKQLAPKPLALKVDGPSISEPIPKKDTGFFVSEPVTKEPDAIPDVITAISNPTGLTGCTDSINENNMKQQEPIPVAYSSYSVLEPMAITNDITGISSSPTLKVCTDSSNKQNLKQLEVQIPHVPKDNKLLISEPIPIKDSSLIEPLTTDDSHSAFDPSIIAASSILDPLPLKSMALLHSKVSVYESSKEQVHPKSPVPVISEPMPLNDCVSLSESMVLNDDTSAAVPADEKNKEQLAPYPLPLKDNEPLILEQMSLKEADYINSVSEVSSNKNAPNIMNGTNTILEQSAEKNKEQTTLKTLAPRAIPLVSDPNLKENISMVPQSLDSSVDDESGLKLTASYNNTLSISDTTSLKYDDSENSELIDLIDSPDSNLKRDFTENPLDAKKDSESSNNKPFVDNNTSPTPIEVMESVNIHPEPHTIKGQLTLGDTGPSKSEPLALNDTILLDSKASAVPLASNPLVLNDNLTLASKPMDLIEIFDTISELHTLEAQLTLGDTVSSTAPYTIPLETKPVTVKDKVTKVSVSDLFTLNENLSSTAEPINLKESADANPESRSVDSRLILGDSESSKSKSSAPIHTIPSESKPVVLKDNITTSSKPLVFIDNVPSTFDSSTSIANSASEPMNITDSIIELTKEVSLTQSDIARMIPETMELKEIAPSVSKDMAQTSNSGITCMSAFDNKSSLSSEAILKCRRNLMTLKHLKYPMCGTLAQKYLKTLKELTDKSGTNVTTNFDPKSKPSNKASMSEEAKVDESKQALILISRQILMSLKSLKYPMSGPIAQKHLKALLDLTNKTQQTRPHAVKSTVSRLAPRSESY